MKRFGQLVGVLGQPVMLGAGAGDADGVRLLKAIRADHEGRHLSGQYDKRDRIHQRVGQAGDRIGRAGAGGHQHDAGAAGRTGIALGHVDRALFVAHKDVANVVLLEDLVIDRQHGAAGIAEDHLDALILERLNHHLRTGHLPRHRLKSPFIPASVTKSPGPDPGRMGTVMVYRHRPMRVFSTSTRIGAIARGSFCCCAADIRQALKGRQPAKLGIKCRRGGGGGYFNCVRRSSGESFANSGHARSTI